MEQEITRRKFMQGIPLVIAGAFFPSFLIPGNSYAFDLNYEPYQRPTKDSLERILARNNFPHEFNFCYEIPLNKDKEGNKLEGGFRIIKTPNSTRLEIDIIHPREKKRIEISELREENVTYSEIKYDFNRDSTDFSNQITRYPNETPYTILNVVNDLFNGKPKNCEFIFYGKGIYPQIYLMEVKKQESDSSVEAKIKRNSPKLKKIRVFYDSIGGLKIPVEVWAGYEVKIPSVRIFGLDYDEHTIKAVLSSEA